jgi:DNA-binding transcriptional LysR family regulator
MLLGVVRLGSINAAARGTNASPSHVSKSIARLERAVGVRVLARSAQGVRLTDAGRELAPRFIDLLDRAQAIRSTPSRTARLTIVAPSWVTAQFLPVIAAALPDVAIHSVDAPPGVPSAYASRPLFDLALTVSDERWPESWVRATVGSFRLGLFASPRTARLLGTPVTPDRLRRETFIGPLYNNGDELRPGDDSCPLPASARTFGHRTQTFAMALTLAETAPHVVFGPAIAAHAHVARGSLVEVPVEGWHVRERFYLDCHQERVSARVQRLVLGALRARLRSLGAEGKRRAGA